MAYSVILSSRVKGRQLKIIHMGFLFPISLLIAGQMLKCYSNSCSGCPFLLSVMSLEVRFDSVFSTVFCFFLNPAYCINIKSTKRDYNRECPSLLCLWIFPLSYTHTHTRTQFFSPLFCTSFFTSILSNIHLCLPRALNERCEHMHN